VRRGVLFAILVLLFVSVQAARAVPESPEPSEASSEEFRILEFDIDLHDAEERPYPLLPPDTADLLISLPAQESLGGRTEVRAGELTFLVDGEPEPFAVSGPRVRVALLAFRDPELSLKYEFRFAYREGLGDPHAGLVGSPYVLEVVAPPEGETPQNRFSLYTNENLHTDAEKGAIALFGLVGALAAWLAAGRYLFRGLLFGRGLSVSAALTFSTAAAVALWIALLLAAAWAWFNPGVNGPHVQYFGYVSAFSAFALLTLVVGLTGKALDAR
jgi:hypothetical protein